MNTELKPTQENIIKTISTVSGNPSITYASEL